MAFTIDEHNREHISGITNSFPFACSTVSYKNLISQSMTWHWHEELELSRIRKGSMKIYTNSSSYILEEGDVYLINNNIINMKCSTDPEKPVVEDTLHFHPIILGGHFHSAFETKYVSGVLTNPNIEIARFNGSTESGRQIISLMKKMKKLPADTFGYELLIRNMLSEVWINILNEIRDYEANLPKNFTMNQNRLHYMVSFIHRHYSEKITVEDIAAAASISSREAARCFKKVRGKTPVDYLTEYRLSIARNLLSDTADSITDIAMKTGFSDSAYFGKTFRKYFEMTPVEYRQTIEAQRLEAEQNLIDDDEE
ncbi:MAG: helix-turn-helix transcriptional regulator [Parasporobacterium sp.]|nr:helix-turn-helix transcriptional regulator [Parasporobacterium sp.]